MRRILSWVLEGLPFDAQSRRAIDETLLDWEREATEARAFSEASVAELRGVAAIARVTSISALREAVDFSWCRGLGRRFGIALGVILLMTFLNDLAIANSASDRIRLSVMLLPATVAQVFTPAIVLILAWRPRQDRLPGFGASLAVALVTLGFVGWLVPWGLDEFRGLAFTLQSDTLEPAFAAGPRGRQLTPTPLQVVGWVMLNGALVPFSNVLAGRWSLQSWLWLPAVPLLLLCGYIAVERAFELPLKWLGYLPARLTLDGVALVVLAVLFLLGALILSRRLPLHSSERSRYHRV
jgi:hypothetical protein